VLPPPIHVVSEEEQMANCLPKPLIADGRLVLLGFYEGAGMSSVAVAGEQVETTTGEIRIAPGKTNLVLALTSYDSMVFRFTGATDRVKQVLVIHSVGSGVTGVPRARVNFVAAPRCYFGWQSPKMAPQQSLPALSGRSMMRTSLYQLDIAQLDDKGLTPIKQHHDAWRSGRTPLEVDMYLFYPAGVVALNRAAVVSRLPARRYTLLPSTAGAVQLERTGAIARLDQRRSELVLAAHRERNPRSNDIVGSDIYEVRRPIRLPIGLCGSHLLTFVVRRPADVSGDPCHSTIITEDGTVVASIRTKLRDDRPKMTRP
jgi:hypothetical protein